MKVRNKSTGDEWFIRDEDAAKLGTQETVHVYREPFLPRHEMFGGGGVQVFIDRRGSAPTPAKKYRADFLEGIPR